MPWIKNWFSNMLAMDRPFEYQGMTFHTVEHFYQAMKLCRDDVVGRHQIASLESPYAAKRACRTSDLRDDGRLREDWEEVQLAVMEFALRKKFASGTSWYQKLVETSGEIVETNNWCDVRWGRCICRRCQGAGRNELGRILEKLRAEALANGARAQESRA